MNYKAQRDSLLSWILGFLAANCLLLGGGCEKKSPLLGRWVYVPNSPGTNTEATAERGIEFLPDSKFVTFGYKANGQTMDQYGTYSLIGSNRVRLDVQGLLTTEDGTNADLKVPAGATKQKFLQFAQEQQQLTEEQSFAEPARFRRSAK